MPALPSRSVLVAVAALVLGAAWLPQLSGWAQPEQAFQLAGLILAAAATSGLGTQRPISRDRAVMPPSFVITFSALLLFDRNAAMLIALAAALTPAFMAPIRPLRWGPILVDAGISVTAIQVAGLVYASMRASSAGSYGLGMVCQLPPR